jgi:purine-binding chemotaxis protein CheW
MSETQRELTRREPDAAATKDDASNVRELLAFELGEDHYALPLACVREIVRLPSVTEVPRGPEDVLGVISVRGAVTTVIDLRKRLRLPLLPFTSRTRVLLVQLADETLGLLVDGVLQVCRVRDDEVELANVLGSEVAPYLVGIGRPGMAAREGARSTAQRVDGPGEILLLLEPGALLKM